MSPMMRIAQDAMYKAGKYINSMLHNSQWQSLDKFALANLLAKFRSQVDKKLQQHIMTSYPHHLLNVRGSDKDYTWYWDILPEEINFLYRIPQFSLTLVCAYNNQAVCGIILNPFTQEEYTIVKGSGARHNGIRVRVSNTMIIDEALIGCSIPANLISISGKLRCSGSSVFDLAYVSSGNLDASIVAADVSSAFYLLSCLLMQETGGIIEECDISNYIESPFIVAANPKLVSIICRK